MTRFIVSGRFDLLHHPVEVAFKQPVLNDSVIFELAFGMSLGNFRTDLAAVLQDVALSEIQKGIQPLMANSRSTCVAHWQN